MENISLAGGEVGSAGAEAYRTEHGIICCSEGALPDPIQLLDDAAKKVISAGLITAMSAKGFAAPTVIQAQGWPVLLAGNDLVAVAKTGSGKTLGFLIPALHALTIAKTDPSNGPAVLVLAPTRELAMQISEESIHYGASVGIHSTVVYGGVPKHPQTKALRSNTNLVLIGTPGRLVDLCNDGAAQLGAVTTLVLDEADRMLDMGFEKEMAVVMGLVQANRQTMLFSATWPKAVQRLASTYLKKGYVHVNIGETEELAANKSVSQEFYKRDDTEKEAKLWELWDTLEESDKMIVFANTKRRIDNLERTIWKYGFKCVAMHGDKTQAERDSGLKDFVAGRCQVLIATDVCARGLDIKDVTHVLNFDMARDVESYVHRIGRTGRAGKTGRSITFFNSDYDMECAPALAKIAHEAGQEVPEFLKIAAAKNAKGNKGQAKLWKY